jgi:hypothetical protein
MGKDKDPVSAESKKPATSQQQGQTEHRAPAPSASKSGAGAGGKVGCHAQACKGKDVRANFCEEHFRQFKFGLITKNGDPVLDYEKKLEHYTKWKQAQKVA